MRACHTTLHTTTHVARRTSPERSADGGYSRRAPQLAREDTRLVRHSGVMFVCSSLVRAQVVPFWHGQELFLACQTRWRARPFWVDGAGHNNVELLLREDGTLFEKVKEFLDEWCTAHQALSR